MERASGQFSLNLSGLSASLGEPPAEGDHKLGTGDQGILTTPRADQDVAITVRGAPKLARLSKAATRSLHPWPRLLHSWSWPPGLALSPGLDLAVASHASLAIAGTSSASSSSWDLTLWAPGRLSSRGGQAAR